MNQRGTATVEFICVLPWLVLALITIVGISLMFLQGSLLQYVAFKGARILNVYNESALPTEQARLLSKTKLDFRNGLLWVRRGRSKTAAPAEFALRGELRLLPNPDSRDKNGQYLLDNPIPYCGGNGDYTLCPD